MLTHFPPIKPYTTHELAVDDTHTLYIEECGEPDGIPIVYVHAGPGTCLDPVSRQFFDPEKYRIILFDQRGCGRSKPHASVENNTTAHLVEDMEKIREYLNIDAWILFGGAWGATLALVYAETHPQNTNALILRGVFLGRPRDIDWFFGSGTRHFFPDYWDDFIKPIPEDERDDLLGAYYRRLTGPDDLLRMTAAKAWSTYEGRVATLEPHPRLIAHYSEPFLANTLARIECHYMLNNCFLEPNQILDNVGKIKDIPGIIVHGRYDMITPLDNSWELYQAWPASELNIIREAGHSSSEPAIVDALILATNRMARGLPGTA
ncbi:MAG: prolyl aminopeptidase [Legionellales bacterium]|nr:prolyl aminopeptidase [Legionellales bacterium]|tara:strand:+ start:13422 stop:14381 length:960 start_codon:yes stop_codon:yes gene_type:complete